MLPFTVWGPSIVIQDHLLSVTSIKWTVICFVFGFFWGLFVLLKLHVSARNLYIPPFLVEKTTPSLQKRCWWFNWLRAPVAINEVYWDVLFRFVCIVAGFLSVPAYSILCVLRSRFTSGCFIDDIFQIVIFYKSLLCGWERRCLI